MSVTFYRFYVPLVLLLCFTLPAFVPWYYWGESFKNAFFVASIFRYVFTLNITWLVNSAAHIWGSHPYEKSVASFNPDFSWYNLTLLGSFRGINPAENRAVAFLTSGEGWHNYHHVFPWDYKAAELGNYSMNMTTMAIDFFHRIGLAYDLKTVPERIVRNRVLRTGDGSHPFCFEDSPYAECDLKEEELYTEIIPEDEKQH